MSEAPTPAGRVDRRLIAALIGAVVITIAAVVVVVGVDPTASSPTASAGSTLPPIEVEDQVVADGRAVPVRSVALAVEVPGTVASVPVRLGQEVKAGDVLVRMDTAAIDAELAGATAAAAAAAARSAQAEASVTQATEQVKVAEANLEQAQAALETARDRNTGEDEAVAARSAARAQVRAARAALVGAQEAAEAAAAEATRAAAAVTSLEIAKDGLILVATFAGTVASLDARAGEQVAAGIPLVRIVDPSDWEFVTTDLDESGIARIRVGDPATVILDGVPGEQIPGTVARVGTYGEDRQGSIVYQVVVTPDGPVPDGVRWNMTATIQVSSGQ
jgi:multidrug resistance efflux pump